MDAERWARVKSAFFAVVEEAPEAREGALTSACGEDAALRREVEELLRADARATAGSALAVPPGALFDSLGEDTDAPAALGPYRLLRRIGTGGMGAVWLAERADDAFRKQVAVKRIRRGLLSDALLRRFRHERQILADLEHPAIARLLDGGTTAEGEPFIVMEYVEGLPIDEYCRSRKLDTRALLALFRRVCAAVQYAHQRLVVHRDLKPANILVTASGEPKLLDFGIAKLLERDAGDDADAPTVTDLRAMTPEYASPEQVAGRPVATGSDVYSLGVVLYELVAGRLPYRLEGLGAHEREAAVLAQEPERPSQTPTDAGADRLPRHLRRDLDTILLKALQKDPARRYPSVERLDGDLARLLAGLPITARPDTLGYRLGKLVRRQRLLTAALLLLLLSLAGGIGATWREARIARRRFEDVRKLANSLIFEFHDEIQNLEGATAVREKLLARALQYLEGLARDAGDDVALQRELAMAFERIGDLQGRPGIASLGQVDAALKSFGRSLEIRERLHAKLPRDVALTRELAASRMRLGHLFGDRGRLRDAVGELQKAIDLLAPVHAKRPLDHPVARDLGTSYMLLGDCFGSPYRPSLGDMEKALAAYRTASEIQRRILAADPKNGERRHFYASSLIRLAGVEAPLGHSRDAEEHARAAREILEAMRPEFPTVTAIRRDLAYLAVVDADRLAATDRAAALALLDGAVATFDRFAAGDPANASAAEDRVWAAVHEGVVAAPVDPERARRAYQRALAALEPQLSKSPERARLVYMAARAHAALAVLAAGSDPRRARSEDEAARALLAASRDRGNRDRRVLSLLFEVDERLGRR